LPKGAERDGETPRQADAFGLSATHLRRQSFTVNEAFAAFMTVGAQGFAKTLHVAWASRRPKPALENYSKHGEAHETLASLSNQAIV
jgi:hypothetical protein